MERLTTRQRTALHLRAVEGLDYRAISQVLGGSDAASRMLVLAARRQILRRMGGHLLP
jgi:DNA-directed RNA polymerase specialized sigma24 family protein